MTEARKPLSKKLRFEVFKRDGFTCQYCGQKPPAVVLEVDHVVAVADGGSDEDHNLLTSCFDCNRGKGARSLDATAAPIDVAGRASLLQERMEQTRAYEALLQEKRDEEEADIDEVMGVYSEAFPGWELFDSTRPSIRQFLRKLTRLEVIEAMELACSRVNQDRAFRYFCGVCWNKIRERS